MTPGNHVTERPSNDATENSTNDTTFEHSARIDAIEMQLNSEDQLVPEDIDYSSDDEDDQPLTQVVDHEDPSRSTMGFGTVAHSTIEDLANETPSNPSGIQDTVSAENAIPVPSYPSVPYPESLEGDGLGELQPAGVMFRDVEAHLQYASDDELLDFLVMRVEDNFEGLGFEMDNEGYYIPTGIFNSLARDKQVKKVPRGVQEALATDKTTLTPEQCVRVAQYSGFVPFPAGETPGLKGNKENGTQVLLSENGAAQLPVVYYGSGMGFTVACHRKWVKPKTAKRYLKEGTGELLGRRTYKAARRNKRYLVRTYKLLISTPDAMGYRHVHLRDEDCSSTGYQCTLAGCLAFTYIGPRPSPKHVIHHKSMQFNNSIEYLEWLTRSENLLLANRVRGNELGRRESTVKLTSKYKNIKDYPNEIFFDHPDPDLPIKINASGDLVFNALTGEFYDITIITYKPKGSNVKIVHVTVSINGQKYIFYRLAVECFTGELLTSREIVDHIDRKRTNNSIGNLSVVSPLQSANNKCSTQKYREDGTMTGVFHREGELWYAIYPAYEVFEKKLRSSQKKTYFSYSEYGGSDGARIAAEWFREQKMRENAEYRKKNSLKHRGRDENGVPLVPAQTAKRSYNSSRRKLLASANPEAKQERKEQVAHLQNQRKRLNRIFSRLGVARLEGYYIDEECARFSDLSYFQEEYLQQNVTPENLDHVITTFRLFKGKTRTDKDLVDSILLRRKEGSIDLGNSKPATSAPAKQDDADPTPSETSPRAAPCATFNDTGHVSSASEEDRPTTQPSYHTSPALELGNAPPHAASCDESKSEDENATAKSRKQKRIYTPCDGDAFRDLSNIFGGGIQKGYRTVTADLNDEEISLSNS